MLRIVARLLILTLVLALLAGCSSDQHENRKPAQSKTQRIPGADMAVGISLISGMAVSPLLTTSLLSTWKWKKTDDTESLPWFCHGWYLILSWLILAMCFTKDLFGPILPATAKKPFDMAELFEDKISAFVTALGGHPLAESRFCQSFTVK